MIGNQLYLIIGTVDHRGTVNRILITRRKNGGTASQAFVHILRPQDGLEKQEETLGRRSLISLVSYEDFGCKL